MSSFSGKGKKKSFGVLEKKVKFQEALTSLGNTWEVTLEMFTAIQGFIRAIYVSTKKTINEVRFDFLYQNYQNQNKIVDMSTLPPCERILFLYVKRVNYIASIWKKANVAKLVLPPITDYGWNEDESLTWASEIFPEEVKKLYSTMSLTPMTILMTVGRVTTRKTFDFVLCYLVLRCIVNLKPTTLFLTSIVSF